MSFSSQVANRDASGACVWELFGHLIFTSNFSMRLKPALFGVVTSYFYGLRMRSDWGAFGISSNETSLTLRSA